MILIPIYSDILRMKKKSMALLGIERDGFGDEPRGDSGQVAKAFEGGTPKPLNVRLKRSERRLRTADNADLHALELETARI